MAIEFGWNRVDQPPHPNLGEEVFDWRNKVAKRKRGKRKGFTLQLEKDYRSEAYVPYIVRIESGILQAATIDPDLTDGDVDQALRHFMAELQSPEALTRLLPAKTDEASPDAESQKTKQDFIQFFVFLNLQDAFAEQLRPISAEDVSGIFGVLRSSLKSWGHGAHRRGYITYLEGFLGQMGIATRRLSEEEAAALGLEPGGPE